MVKDRIITFRVPESVWEEVSILAQKQGVSVSRLMKDFIVNGSWRVELQRNRAYHQQVLAELDKVEKRLSRVRVKTLEKYQAQQKAKAKAGRVKKVKAIP